MHCTILYVNLYCKITRLCKIIGLVILQDKCTYEERVCLVGFRLYINQVHR
jgi:hypothetical protein